MKIALVLSALLLVGGLGLLGAAYGMSEDQYFVYSWYVLGAAPVPVGLVVLYRLSAWVGRMLGAYGRDMAARAETNAAERRARAGAAKAEAVRAEAEAAAAVSAARQAAGPPQLAAVAPALVPAPQAVVVRTAAANELPTHRNVRLGLAAAALFATLVLPQFAIFVTFNGFQIIKSHVQNIGEIITEISAKVKSKPVDNSYRPAPRDTQKSDPDPAIFSSFVLILAPFLIIGGLVAQTIMAFKDRPRVERWIGAGTFGIQLLALIDLGLLFTSLTNKDKDNPFSAAVGAAVGFQWGFYVAIVLCGMFAAAAFAETKRTVAVTQRVSA